MFDKAYQLTNDASYLDERDQVKHLQSDAARVQTQTAPAPSGS